MQNRTTTGADRRTRIHVRPSERGVLFSLGPCGRPIEAESLGQAVEVAIDSINGEPAVIIWAGGDRG